MNRYDVMPVGAATIISLTLLGCVQEVPLGGRCNSTSCRGCCDPHGVCQLGVANNSCGNNGGMCLVCSGQQQCTSGLCQGTGTGGGSGTGGGGNNTGGGTGGGGIDRIGQELVSGSRLRASWWIGPDGSRASSNMFWDTELLTYCAVSPSQNQIHSAFARVLMERGLVSQDAVGLMCLPMFCDQSDRLIDGATCAGRYLFEPMIAGIDFLAMGSHPLTPVFGIEYSDGGYGLVHVVELRAGEVHSELIADGGCTTRSYRPLSGSSLYRTTTPASISEIAQGTMVTE